MPFPGPGVFPGDGLFPGGEGDPGGPDIVELAATIEGSSTIIASLTGGGEVQELAAVISGSSSVTATLDPPPVPAPEPEPETVLLTRSAPPSTIETPHTAFPLRYRNGRPVVVEQDSAAHMRDRVRVTCLTPLGDLLHDPTFGIDRQLLTVKQIDLDLLAAQITQSEPSIAIDVSRDPDAAGMALPGAADETVRVDLAEHN